jgi:hypothetical protein
MNIKSAVDGRVAVATCIIHVYGSGHENNVGLCVLRAHEVPNEAQAMSNAMQYSAFALPSLNLFRLVVQPLSICGHHVLGVWALFTSGSFVLTRAIPMLYGCPASPRRPWHLLLLCYLGAPARSHLVCCGCFDPGLASINLCLYMGCAPSVLGLGEDVPPNGPDGTMALAFVYGPNL